MDGSFVEANAAKESRIPREQLAEAAQVHHIGAAVSAGSRRTESGGRAGARAGSGIDHRSRFHLRHQGRHAGASRLLRQLSGRQPELRDRGSAGHGGAHEPGNRGRARHAHPFRRSGKDESQNRWQRTRRTGTGSSCNGWRIASITPYMRTRDSIHRKRSPFFGPERFTYEPEHDRYICPAGQPLNYGGQSHRNHSWTYIGTRKRCGPCALRPQCTSAAFRCLVIHQHEPARQRARELANTPEFAKAQRQRKKVEALFAELKNQIGLRRLRLRTTEVRARTVLPGSGGAEHQATGALPQPTDNSCYGSCHLAEVRGTPRWQQ